MCWGFSRYSLSATWTTRSAPTLRLCEQPVATIAQIVRRARIDARGPDMSIPIMIRAHASACAVDPHDECAGRDGGARRRVRDREDQRPQVGPQLRRRGAVL